MVVSEAEEALTTIRLPGNSKRRAAYKRLLVHSEISAGNRGNAVNLEKITILSCTTKSVVVNENGEDLEMSEEYEALEKTIRENIEKENYSGSEAWDLTIYVQDIVQYISGFVVKLLQKSVTCLKCQQLFECDEVVSMLQKRKTFGRLKIASPLITTLCKEGERFFRFFDKTVGIFNQKANKNLVNILISKTVQNFSINILEYFGDHIFDEDPLENHCMEIVKLVLKNYFNIRIHHEVSKKLDVNKQNRIRSLNTKTILFKNQ